MDTRADQAATAVPEALERELTMIRAAISMVASGASPRVELAGLRLVDPILGELELLAARSGVRLVPMWTAAEQLADLAIERVEP